MKVENLDHLEIVAGIIDEMGIVEEINTPFSFCAFFYFSILSCVTLLLNLQLPKDKELLCMRFSSF